MLFKEEHRLMILKGEKTETRRPAWRVNGKSHDTTTPKASRPAVPGRIHLFYTRPAFANPPGLPFCKAKILSCEREPLWQITEKGAIAEGYQSIDKYVVIWDRIWGEGSWNRDCRREVFVIRFEVVEQLLCAKCWQAPAIKGQLRAWNQSRELYCISCHGPGCDNG
jgi:hypothetical protein